MGYNFRELFYQLFKNKENYVFAFDVKTNIIFSYCILFYLNEIKSSKLNRLLSDGVNANLIQKDKNSLMAQMYRSRNITPQLVSLTDTTMFRDSFNRPAFGYDEINVSLDDFNSFNPYDLIVAQEKLTDNQYHDINHLNKSLQLPIFLKWDNDGDQFAKTFPNGILVKTQQAKKGKSIILLNIVQDSKVVETIEIKYS